MWLSLRALSASQGDRSSEAIELRHDIIRFSIVGTWTFCAICYAAVAVAPWWTSYVPGFWLTCLLYGAACLLAYRLLSKDHLAGEAVWLGGWTASVALAMYLYHDPHIAVLLILVPMLAALTTGWLAAALAEVVVAGIVLLPLLHSTPFPRPGGSLALTIIIAGGLGGIVGWGVAQAVARMAQWLLQSSDLARKTLEEVRDQRLEMKQVQEDLILANRELSRLSDLLKQMWQIAQEARQAKAEFVANVSHELRTPLNMIVGFAELITGAPRIYGHSLPPALLADIDAIHVNAQHLARLVDDILDLSQVEAGRMALTKSWTSIPSIIEDAVREVKPFYDSKGLYVHTDIDGDIPQVYCDATRIRQVLLNLLSNAGRLMQQGGVCIRAHSQADDVTVSVADTGPGIPSSQIPRLFQPFSQLDAAIRKGHGGSGLGLSISKQFVEMHGGRMWVESEVGQGTVFHFNLPAGVPLPIDSSKADAAWKFPGDEAEYKMRTRPFRAPLAQPMPRIVVLEKGHTLGRLIGRYMDDVEVETVGEIQEAMHLLRHAPASAILVDGFCCDDPALLDRALTRLPYAPPIVTCWFAGDEAVARELGIACYVPKPVTRKRLLSAVDAIGQEVHTVLVVDDEPEVLRLFTRILSSTERSYRVLRATTGARALHLLQSEQPDLMILDLVMPEMDGIQVLRQKAADPNIRSIPVIATSAKGLSTEPLRTDRITIASYGGLALTDFLACIRIVGRVQAGKKKSGDPGPGGTPAG